MPQYFRFYIGHNLHFRGQLDSLQCRAQTRAGHRCGRTTVIGLGLCWSHLLSTRQLRIQPSTVAGAGKGLFAMNHRVPANRVIFHENAVICEYGGEVIDNDDLEERYDDHTGPYVVRINRNRYEDGALERGIGTIACHQDEPNENARLAIYSPGPGLNNKIRLVATKAIRNGREIFVNYGDEYEMDEPGVHYSTTARRI